MLLRDFQYSRILQEYEQRRLDNKHILDKRYQEIYNTIPEFRSIEEQISGNSIAFARKALFDTSASSRPLAEQNRKLSEQKRLLLKQHGYPMNYLDPIYNCPDCKDTGYVHNQKCKCLKQTIVNFLYEQTSVRHILEIENFSTFSFDYYAKNYIDETVQMSPYDNICHVVTECQSFIERFDTEHTNLLLYGNTGVGKTFLANCITKELLSAGHTVVYLTSFQLFDVLEKCKFSKDREDILFIEDKYQYILDCDLLVIDDLGVETVNSFSASQLFLCINERCKNERSTIISTNLAIDDIGITYSERVFSRIISNYKLLKIVGEDIRLKKVFS